MNYITYNSKLNRGSLIAPSKKNQKGKEKRNMSKEKDIKIVCDDCMKEKGEIKMTMGINAMQKLGYILSYINTSDNAYYITMRQFEKYDDKGYITDLINFFYCENDGVEVYTNSLKHQCGTRLNRDLLNAILLNFNEIEKEMVKIR